jgi:hypothetical protein
LETGAAALLAGGSVGPLGLFIAAPLGLFGALSAYASDEYCSPRTRTALGNPDQWVRSTFGSVPALTDVADAARRQVRGPAGPQVLVSEAGQSSQARESETRGIAGRLGTVTVILADVYVEFGEMVQGCRIRLTARADIRVQPAGQPEMTAPRFSLWAEQDDVPLEDWVQNPERAREELRRLLGQLGSRLIEAYRDRMGCSERDCGW